MIESLSRSSLLISHYHLETLVNQPKYKMPPFPQHQSSISSIAWLSPWISKMVRKTSRKLRDKLKAKSNNSDKPLVIRTINKQTGKVQVS